LQSTRYRWSSSSRQRKPPEWVQPSRRSENQALNRPRKRANSSPSHTTSQYTNWGQGHNQYTPVAHAPSSTPSQRSM
jgi:hypothetical protein